MGSGHILVYAFDLLVQIYQKAGYSERDAAGSILENNIYGLDVDERAAQLAYFAVMMKARQYDRRILTRGIQPRLYGPGPDPDVREYGSLLQPKQATEARETAQLSMLDESDSFKCLLTQKYDVVVTNPPYMGAGNMNAKLSEYVKAHFPDEKADLFACFIEKSHQLAKPDGFTSLITMESWMFLSSFETLRKKITKTRTIINMVHMPYLGRGGTSLGIDFGTAAVIMRNQLIENYIAQYQYITYYETDENGVPFAFPTINERWKTAKQSNFSKIPGAPIAYWVSEKFIKLFSEFHVSDVGKVVTGMTTADNDRFLRYWHEIDICKSSLASTNNAKWFPYQKGGDYCKWYGNNEWVVNWEKDGLEIKNNVDPSTGKIRSSGYNENYIKKKGLTWTYITSASIGVRFVPNGFLFDNKGSMVFFESDDDMYINLGFLCSKIAMEVSQVLNPTISFQPGNMQTMPSPKVSHDSQHVIETVKTNIDISKSDWDSYETSWDFKKHPLV